MKLDQYAVIRPGEEVYVHGTIKNIRINEDGKVIYNVNIPFKMLGKLNTEYDNNQYVDVTMDQIAGSSLLEAFPTDILIEELARRGNVVNPRKPYVSSAVDHFNSFSVRTMSEINHTDDTNE